MSIHTTYTKARANLAKLCDEAVDNREVVVIQRRGAKNVALIAEDELTGLIETAHLLRSPRNARRLLEALRDARARKVKPQTVEEFRREVGLVEEA